MWYWMLEQLYNTGANEGMGSLLFPVDRFEEMLVSASSEIPEPLVPTNIPERTVEMLHLRLADSFHA